MLILRQCSAPMSAGGRQPKARGGVCRDWRATHPLVYEYYASLCEAQNLNWLFAHPLIVAFGSFRRFCGVFDRFGLPSITDRRVGIVGGQFSANGGNVADTPAHPGQCQQLTPLGKTTRTDPISLVSWTTKGKRRHGRPSKRLSSDKDLPMVSHGLRTEWSNKDFAFVRRGAPKSSVNQAVEQGEARNVLLRTLDISIASPNTRPHGAFGRVSLR